MRKLRFEIYSRRSLLRGKQWYFRLKGGNGETIAQSEGYKNAADCANTAELIRSSAHESGVVWLNTR